MSKDEITLSKLNGLRQKVCELRIKWKYFVQVFGHEARVSLLNSTAAAFFRFAEDAMLQDILLSISRLIDPPKSAGKETLSLNNILCDIDDDAFRADFSKRISSLAQATASIKSWRNKALAHNDLSHSLSGIALPAIQVRDLRTVIALLEEATNLLSRRLGTTPLLYEEIITPLSDGNALLARLKLGDEIFHESPSKLCEISDWLQNSKPGIQ